MLCFFFKKINALIWPHIYGHFPSTPFENIFSRGVMFNEASSIKVSSSEMLFFSMPFSFNSFLISSCILISFEKKYEHIFPVSAALSRDWL